MTEEAPSQTTTETETIPPVPSEPAPDNREAGPPAPNAVSAFLGILVAPKETFGRLAGRGGWSFLFPLVLLILVTTVSGVIFTHRVDMTEFIREQIRQSPRAGDMSETQMEEGVRMGVKWAKAMTYVGFVTVILKYVIVALVLWLVVLAFGNTIGFWDTFRVVSWSQIPNILFALLAIVVIFVKDPMTLDPQNMIASNLGALLGKERLGKPLYALLSDLDAFTLWLLYLYSRGLSSFAKAGIGKMATISFGLFGILVTLHVAWSAIF